jgi:hypothetical protein
MHIVTIHDSEVTGLIKFYVSYVCKCIHYAFQRLSLSAQLHCIHQELHTFPKDGSPNELGQVTSAAKQPDAAAQSNGFENVD